MREKLIFSLMILTVFTASMSNAFAATTRDKGQSVIQSGTNVRERVTAQGLYDQTCYDAYYGCMDQFCILDNTNGGTCACSDQNADLEREYNLIKNTLNEADRIEKVEVEKIMAGAQADIIFNGTRRYDKDGNVVGVNDVVQLTEEEEKEQRKKEIDDIFNKTIYDDDDDDEFISLDLIAEKSGSELFDVAEKICVGRAPESCSKDIPFLRQLYSRQILADCKAFENENKTAKANAMKAMAKAESAVVEARKKMYKSVNEYGLGECMVAFKKCMVGEDACGDNWENCVFGIASQNMQNDTSTDNKQYRENVSKWSKEYDITTSTLEIISAKRDICERVLDKCMAVRDQVWEKFLREAAPTIKIAEQKAESKMRQSCLGDITECIQIACISDIAHKGVATMDACLAKPEMVRSFCKIELDRCEKMDSGIWDFVKLELASLGSEACEQEVKDCLTDENRCGPNFENCIGLDLEYVQTMCPVERLVVCSKGKPDFKQSDIEFIVRGLYNELDLTMLTQCQKIIDERMKELCESTTDCNRFAADDTLGTGSLRLQKRGDVYRISGMISFGSIKMGQPDGSVKDETKDEVYTLKPGEIGVDEYIERVREKGQTVPDSEGIIATIEEELNNIAGTINRTIAMIEQDPKVQFCAYGRDLSNIQSEARTTVGRYPNILNDAKMVIAGAALAKAQQNYNRKLDKELIPGATKDAEIDVAQYMCQKIAETGENMGAGAKMSTPLVPPYSIVYDIGTGLGTADLTTGGKGHFTTQVEGNGSGITKDITSVFNRETRNCHVCTTVTTTNCKKNGSSLFHRSKHSCSSTTAEPICEDIPM